MLKIEFLYYDKTSCKRCASTDKAVKMALLELKKALKDAKVKAVLKERRLPESRIRLSPSVLINGRDVEKILGRSSKLKSNVCSDCCRLAGHPVNCRTFRYRGKAYDHIPKAMIMEAVRIALKSGIK